MADFSENDILRMIHSDTVEPNRPVRKITIGRPHLEIKRGIARLRCNIKLGCVEKEVFFSVDEKYANYLCCERGDAYLIGLLSLAMRERCDIHSEAPLTGELVHQLQTELIPVLVKYSTKLYAPVITGELSNDPVPNKGAVATGCSCGVDSLHAIKLLSTGDKGIPPLEYVVINNVGAYGAVADQRFTGNMENSQQFAQQYGYKLIITDSNFAEVFPQDHLKTHLYSSGFAIYSLRKLWSRYYYASSGCDLESFFGLTNNEQYDAAKYDLIALAAFSIPGLRICNAGMGCSRHEKITSLADYKPAQQYLNVCFRQGKGNCGICEKCKRTMWILDAIGKLDNFHAIFPVQQYRETRSFYLRELYRAKRRNVPMIEMAYSILCKEISFFSKVYAVLEERWQHCSWWQKLRVHARRLRSKH